MAVQGNGTDLGTLSASADLSAKQFCAVVVSGSNTVNAAGAGVNAIGILQNKPTSGSAATVRIAGVSKVIAGAAVAAGADLMSDASGNLITATSGNFIVGKALQAASGVGVVIGALLRPGGVKP